MQVVFHYQIVITISITVPYSRLTQLLHIICQPCAVTVMSDIIKVFNLVCYQFIRNTEIKMCSCFVRYVWTGGQHDTSQRTPDSNTSTNTIYRVSLAPEKESCKPHKCCCFMKQCWWKTSNQAALNTVLFGMHSSMIRFLPVFYFFVSAIFSSTSWITGG